MIDAWNLADAVLRERDYAGLRDALDANPEIARKPQLVLRAAGGAQLDALKLLLRKGADPNSLWRGYRPLHALIQEKPHAAAVEPEPVRLKCFDWLLAHGADPELHAAWPPARAILVAAFVGTWVYIERLLKAGAKDDNFVACAVGDSDRVRAELARNSGFADERDGGELTSLQCCAGSRLGAGRADVRRNLMRIAIALLDAGADAAARTRSWRHEVDAVYLAVSAENQELLDLFLTRGGDATTALVAAAWRKSDHLAQVCMNHGADPNRAVDDGKPLLNQMVRWGVLHRARWLLARGADPNLADDRGWTALHQAASRGSARIFKELVAAGGDPHRKNYAGITPLQLGKRDYLK